MEIDKNRELKQTKTVICFIDWYSPGYKAGGITTAFVNFVAQMKEYYFFYIITRNNDYTEDTPYKDVESNTWVKVNENEHVCYVSSDFVTSQHIKRIVKEVQFDFIYINGIYSYWFSLFPAFIFRKHTGIVINPHGMLSQHAIAVKSFKKDIFIKLANLIKLYKNVTFHVADDAEANAVANQIKYYKEIKIAFQFPRKVSEVIKNTNREKEPLSLNLLCIARIAPEKNIHYILEILEKCTNKVQLDLYGPVYNEEYWKQCKAIINRLPGNIVVDYKGSIESNKVIEAIPGYHFMFMPSTGENFGHVILEALQTGTPVIISDRTPWRNLQEVRSMKDEERSDERVPGNKDLKQNKTYEGNSGVGWDIPLENPERFVEVIEYCAAMGQEEYDAMSRRAFE